MAEALRAATARLSAIGDTARLDAELLMAHALECSRSDLLLRHLRDPAPEGFVALVERRIAHEPVAYIVGCQDFFGLDFAVRPGVLIPRGDSETIVRAALEAKPDAGRLLDLGTGSGALLLACLSELPGATGLGIDASPIAVEVAQANAAALGLAGRTEIRRSSWHDSGWSDGLGPFDLVLCNPPYVESGAPLEPDVREYEPGEALFAGAEGLDDYRAIIPQLNDIMTEKGVAVLEIGHEQAGSVASIAADRGFTSELRRDLARRPRGLILRRNA